MRQILVYGDSLSWGIVPNTRQRLPFSRRWPGVMEQELSTLRHQVRIIEDCLNGRRTVLDDPHLPGRNGLRGLSQKVEMHSPLSLIILMLGTNDFQATHTYTAQDSARGIATLIETIRTTQLEPGMPSPAIMVVAPPAIGIPKGEIAHKFEGAQAKATGLARAYRDVSAALECAYVDAGTVTSSSLVDGVHLDEDQHALLGRALAPEVAVLLGNVK